MSHDNAISEQIWAALRAMVAQQEAERASPGRRRPADTAAGWRWCAACKVHHPRAAFGPSNRGRKGPADGLRSTCLEAESRQTAARKRAAQERRRAQRG